MDENETVGQCKVKVDGSIMGKSKVVEDNTGRVYEKGSHMRANARSDLVGLSNKRVWISTLYSVDKATSWRKNTRIVHRNEGHHGFHTHIRCNKLIHAIKKKESGVARVFFRYRHISFYCAFFFSFLVPGKSALHMTTDALKCRRSARARRWDPIGHTAC